MLKKIYKFIFFSLIIFSSSVSSQQNWEYVGKFRGNEIYYIKNSVSKGPYTYVLVVIKPGNTSVDDFGNKYDYATVSCIYLKDYRNEIMCRISNKIYYYNDNTQKKSIMPSIEVRLNFDKIVSDLYYKITQ